MQLESIDVSCNLLTRLPDSLGMCVSLRRLYASGNQLVNVPSTVGALMHILEVFDISDNPMVRRNAGANDWFPPKTLFLVVLWRGCLSVHAYASVKVSCETSLVPMSIACA